MTKRRTFKDAQGRSPTTKPQKKPATAGAKSSGTSSPKKAATTSTSGNEEASAGSKQPPKKSASRSRSGLTAATAKQGAGQAKGQSSRTTVPPKPSASPAKATQDATTSKSTVQAPQKIENAARLDLQRLAADECARADKMRDLLTRARWYVADALEAHEHTDGRDLLREIDASTGETARPMAQANQGYDYGNGAYTRARMSTPKEDAAMNARKHNIQQPKEPISLGTLLLVLAFLAIVGFFGFRALNSYVERTALERQISQGDSSTMSGALQIADASCRLRGELCSEKNYLQDRLAKGDWRDLN